MSVRIDKIDIDMPKNCYDCDLCSTESLHVWCPIMNAPVGSYCKPNSKTRHPKCPLKENNI